MKFRNLEGVPKIIKGATGLDVSYAYEDLVFPDHMAFLIQFDDRNDKNLLCFFHSDCNPKEKTSLLTQMKKVASADDITLENRGRFLLEPKGEEVQIKFIG